MDGGLQEGGWRTDGGAFIKTLMQLRGPSDSDLDMTLSNLEGK